MSMNEAGQKSSLTRSASALLLLLFVCLFSSTAQASKAPKKAYQALHSKYYKVRIKAVSILASSSDPRAVEAIADMLDDSEPLVQAAACDALTSVGQPDHIQRIKPLLRSKDDLVRRRARLAIRILNNKAARQSEHSNAAQDRAQSTVVQSKHSRHITGTPNSACKQNVRVEQAKDRSKSGYSSLAATLQKAIERSMNNRGAALQGIKKKYLLIPQVSKVQAHISDNESRVDVTCHITVVELPQKSLRLSTQVTAAAAQSGRASQQDQQELAQDAAGGAGDALMNEFVEWALSKK